MRGSENAAGAVPTAPIRPVGVDYRDFVKYVKGFVFFAGADIEL